MLIKGLGRGSSAARGGVHGMWQSVFRIMNRGGGEKGGEGERRERGNREEEGEGGQRGGRAGDGPRRGGKKGGRGGGEEKGGIGEILTI